MNVQKLENPAPKLLKRQQAEARYNMSWNTLLKAAGEAGALVRYGRSVFFNATIMDRYFDSLSGTD
ncbi:MAG: DUF6462 family protein [Lachnospiraceae bacterium]|nr:DUF6462 family protein [Lachnospiraceae bacterium]